MPVIFLDTGFHFPETLAFRDKLVTEFKLNLRVVKAEIGNRTFLAQYGELYRRDPDMCCYINKIEPMEKARQALEAWISGIRRDQTPDRARTEVVAREPDGVYKISPLASWSSRDVSDFIARHDLPVHPLWEHGYRSIGCAPCTRAVPEGADDRSGRWIGWDKRECGLHTSPLDSGVTALGDQEGRL